MSYFAVLLTEEANSEHEILIKFRGGLDSINIFENRKLPSTDTYNEKTVLLLHKNGTHYHQMVHNFTKKL